jgi:hypothetical protein
VTNRKLEDITSKELYAFIGTIIATGQNCEKRLHLDDMWTGSKHCLQPFSGTAMSNKRYKSVFRFIRLDDTEKRQNHISAAKSKLEAVHSTFDQFSLACTRSYSSGCNLPADEG